MNVTTNDSYSHVVWMPQFPSAYDNVDGEVNASCFVMDGNKKTYSNDTYDVGVTPVYCNASDAAGNIGGCTFNITVEGKFQNLKQRNVGIYNGYLRYLCLAIGTVLLLSFETIAQWQNYSG